MERLVKSIVAIILSLVMFFSVIVNVYAEATTNTGTIGTDSGQSDEMGGYSVITQTQDTAGWYYLYSTGDGYPRIYWDTIASEPETFIWKVDTQTKYASSWPLQFSKADEVTIDKCIKRACLMFQNYTGLSWGRSPLLETMYTWTLFADSLREVKSLWVAEKGGAVEKITPAIVAQRGAMYENDGHEYAAYQGICNALIADSDLVNALNSNGYSWNSGDQWYWSSAEEVALNCVYITENDVYREYGEESEPDIKTPKYCIVSVKNSDKSSENYDYTGKSAEWLYDNCPTTATYYGKSSSTDKIRYDKTIEAIVYKVTRTYHAPVYIVEYDGSGNVIGREIKTEGYYTYSWSNYGTYSKDINYETNSVDNPQTYYTPINLNRNGAAKAIDYRNYYNLGTTAGTLDITVDNKQDITDGITGIPMLDINSKQSWTLKFNTTNFGLPSSFASATNPYERYKTSSGYSINIFSKAGKNSFISGTLSTDDNTYSVNGYVTDPFRYGMYLSATFPGSDVSIQLNSESEVLGNASLSFGNSSTKTVNTITTRSIKTGTYYLGNENNDNPFWELSYNQTRVRTYGIEYSGTITRTGIGEPTVKSNDFYADSSTKVLFQPVLYGVFSVKTVGGSVK